MLLLLIKVKPFSKLSTNQGFSSFGTTVDLLRQGCSVPVRLKQPSTTVILKVSSTFSQLDSSEALTDSCRASLFQKKQTEEKKMITSDIRHFKLLGDNFSQRTDLRWQKSAGETGEDEEISLSRRQVTLLTVTFISHHVDLQIKI